MLYKSHRQIILKSIIIINLIYPIVAQGAVKSLCQENQETFFSCVLDNKKIVSLCGSSTNDEQSINLNYRIGTISDLDLIYPPDNTNNNKLFRYKINYRANSEVVTILFEYNNRIYSLYRDFVYLHPGYASGIIIFDKITEDIIEDISCHKTYIDEIDIITTFIKRDDN